MNVTGPYEPSVNIDSSNGLVLPDGLAHTPMELGA